MNNNAERRVYPRAARNLSLKLHSEDFDVVTQTKNISANGVFCEVDKHIPMMTKLNVVLMLPVSKKRVEKIECEGIVARAIQIEQKESLNSIYNIAIFFNKISNADTNKIAKYVSKHLSK